jgi:hypothetical protein
MDSETMTQPATEDSQELTQETFLHHINAMRTHYKSDATVPYDLPNHLLHPATTVGFASTSKAAAPSPGKAQMDAALKKGQTDTQALAKRQTDFVNAQASKLQGNHDTGAFAKAMQAQKAKAKADADKQIDQQYDQLIKIGTEHPELQQPILSVSQRIGAFFTSLLAKVGAFFLDVYHKIVGWIHSAVDWIKGVAADAAQWLSHTGGEIVSFFSSIF